MFVLPQLVLDLMEWTAYLDQQDSSIDLDNSDNDNGCYVLFETNHAADEEDFLERSLSITRNRQVKVKILLKSLFLSSVTL